MPEQYCKHCGAEVSLETEFCPKCFPERKATEAVPAVFLVLLVASSLLMVGTSYVNVQTVDTPPPRAIVKKPANMQAAAYDAAKNFVNQRFTGDRLFDPLGHSPFEQMGDSYIVTLTASEAAPGGVTAVRNTYRVEMEYAGGEWKLTDIRQ